MKPFKGLVKLFNELVKAIKGPMKPFKGLVKLFNALVKSFKALVKSIKGHVNSNNQHVNCISRVVRSLCTGFASPTKINTTGMVRKGTIIHYTQQKINL
jgi:hypothetical protein